MTVTTWHQEPINKRHDRETFDCGEEALNEFLRRYARKSHEMGGAKTFPCDGRCRQQNHSRLLQPEPRFG
jgi:hypothetical protein